MKRSIQVLILSLIVVVLLPVQPVSQQTQSHETPSSRLRVVTELVTAEALVLDKKSAKVVGTLRQDEFELYEENIKQTLSHFGIDSRPLSVVLLIDVSLSVQYVTREIAEKARKILRQFKSDDEVALMSFHCTTKSWVDFTKDRDLIADKLKDSNMLYFEPSPEVKINGTVISDSIYRAAEILQRSSNPPGRRVIIIVTDNLPDNTGTIYSEKQVVDQLLEAGCIVYGVRVNPYRSSSKSSRVVAYLPTSILGDAVYRIMSGYGRHGGDANTYAEKTGGMVLDGRKDKAAEKLAELIQMLRQRYSFGYTSTNPVMDGRFRKIKVKLRPEAEKRYGKVTILARPGYYARRPAQMK